MNVCGPSWTIQSAKAIVKHTFENDMTSTIQADGNSEIQQQQTGGQSVASKEDLELPGIGAALHCIAVDDVRLAGGRVDARSVMHRHVVRAVDAAVKEV